MTSDLPGSQVGLPPSDDNLVADDEGHAVAELDLLAEGQLRLTPPPRAGPQNFVIIYISV